MGGAEAGRREGDAGEPEARHDRRRRPEGAMRTSRCTSRISAQMPRTMRAGSVRRMRLLVLTRHGQSVFNVSGVVNGDPALDQGLTDAGRAACGGARGRARGAPRRPLRHVPLPACAGDRTTRPREQDRGCPARGRSGPRRHPDRAARGPDACRLPGLEARAHARGPLPGRGEPRRGRDAVRRGIRAARRTDGGHDPLRLPRDPGALRDQRRGRLTRSGPPVPRRPERDAVPLRR